MLSQNNWTNLVAEFALPAMPLGDLRATAKPTRRAPKGPATLNACKARYGARGWRTPE